MKMYEYLESTARKFPDNAAYQFMGKKTSYRRFCAQIEEAAKSLIAIGVRENDIICVAMPNVPQAVIMVYAANRIGAVVNMIHPLSSENEFSEYVNKVHAETILVLDQSYEKIRAIRPRTSLKNIIVAQISEVLDPVKKIAYRLTEERKYNFIKKEKGVTLWKDFIKRGVSVNTLPAVSDRSDAPALILNSGGTTGKSKGVCLSNNNVNTAAIQMIEANPMLDSSDRFLSVMPIFHGNGLVVGIHVLMMIGARCVLIPRFTPDSYAKDLLKNRCNYMSGVPALFEQLMAVDVMKDADLSFLKGVFSGADYLSVELERKINRFLAEHNSSVCVRQGYGMTEGVVATTLNPAENPREGSVGLPLNGVQVKIVEPGSDKELPVDEVGEIVFSSETNMLYYYDDPEETADILRKHSDGKYWIHSGDLGTEDADGFFYFKGRIKRMITVNGYNVFPNEIENIIEGFEMVDRCCVLGVDNGRGSQKVKAFIVLRKGYDASLETEQDILKQCRAYIVKYALPKDIEFISAMPKTKVGKVDYNVLLGEKR